MSEDSRLCGVVVRWGKRTQAVEHEHTVHDLVEAVGPFDRVVLPE
ncbi:MAG TPA: hypothetical protein VN719_01245 [Gemmatimonadales bacterium]|nr:hypothetical protein [Gemmatimonadales bacterium]